MGSCLGPGPLHSAASREGAASAKLPRRAPETRRGRGGDKEKSVMWTQSVLMFDCCAIFSNQFPARLSKLTSAGLAEEAAAVTLLQLPK